VPRVKLLTNLVFSPTADTSGGKNDWQNNQCTLDFLEVIEYIQPPFVSMENVPGLASKRKINGAEAENKFYLEYVVGKLLSMGYNVRTTMILASHYGDPQARKRLVLFASKGYMLPDAPLRTHGDTGEGIQPTVKVHDKLHDLESIEPSCSGRVKLLNGKTVRAHYFQGTAITNISDNDIRLNTEHPFMAPDEPAKTVRKKNKIVHYSLDRYLTALEYKRLMSFPDNHVICGTQSEVRDQIGNAVLCKFAEAIGKTIMASYRQGECMVDLLPSSTA
jgi:DNA (cytosine-5)-methyltransferase 1